MLTVHAAIGNSDDKLTQENWAEYVYAFRRAMVEFSDSVHGVWFSLPDSPFQNCCIAVTMESAALPMLRDLLVKCRAKFGQDSIALNVSETEFV